MSYSTNYKLTPILHKPANDPLRSVLGEPDPCFASIIKKWTGSNPFSDRCAWYSHEYDMTKLSEQFPAYVFRLRLDGEESEDICVKHFFQGKMHLSRAKITFENPPPSFWL